MKSRFKFIRKVFSLNEYFSLNSIEKHDFIKITNLDIHFSVGKAPEKRNIHKLTVSIKKHLFPHHSYKKKEMFLEK